MLLTFTQALQLVGLAPSLFVILFLLALSARNKQAIVPIFYFAALVSSFAMPLLDLYPPQLRNKWVEGGLLLGESTLTAFSFLLISQFITGRIPTFKHWLILAIPLLGGSSLIYATMLQNSYACAKDQTCPDVATIKTLYHVFSSSVIFLLLMYYTSRAGGLHSEDVAKKHKYWLIIALILLHLMELAVELARALGQLNGNQAILISTMFKLTFIYLVLTSLFRVFYPGLATNAMNFSEEETYDPEVDKPHAEKVKVLLERDHVYRQMRLNRAKLAEMVGISEYHLSRVINRHFSKNFNELVNCYRIEEAKTRLRNESSQITVIGFEVGFNSIASFNRVFRAKVGISPTEYRSNERVQ